MAELFTEYHNCTKPAVMKCPSDVEEFIYRWRCPECRSMWAVTVSPKSVWDFSLTAPVWHRKSNPSWRWKRRRSAELAAAQDLHEVTAAIARADAAIKRADAFMSTRKGGHETTGPPTKAPKVPPGLAPGADLGDSGPVRPLTTNDDLRAFLRPGPTPSPTEGEE